MNKHFCLTLTLCAGLVACDGDIKPFEDALTVQKQQLQSLQFEGLKSVVDVGEQLTLRVLAIDIHGNTSDFTQKVDWHAPATGVISLRGAQLQGDRVGTAVLTAQFSHLTVSGSVTVSDAQLQSMRLEAPSNSLKECSRAQLKAVGIYSDNTERDETARALWRVEGAASRISSSGLLDTLNAGTVTVQAQFNGVQATALSLSVTDSLQSLSVSPTSFTKQVNQSQQLSATGQFTDNTSSDLSDLVTWQFNGLSDVLSVDDKGLVNAKTVGAGAVSAACGGLSASSQATIEAAASVVSIDINDGDNPVEVTMGDNVRLSLQARRSDNTTFDARGEATWEVVSGSDVLRVDNDDDRGRLSLLRAGTASVRATYQNQNDQIEVVVRARN